MRTRTATEHNVGGGADSYSINSGMSRQIAGKRPSKRSRWQGYVDDGLLRTGQVSEAAIHGLDGKRWASSPGLLVRLYSEVGPSLYLCISFAFFCRSHLRRSAKPLQTSLEKSRS